MNKTFYITFKQSSEYRNNYVKLQAGNYEDAHELAKIQYPNDYSMIYMESEFDPIFYPGGQLDA
jgi:hypothetical protein